MWKYIDGHGVDGWRLLSVSLYSLSSCCDTAVICPTWIHFVASFPGKIGH